MSQSIATFNHFNLLPQEIRLQIWALAMPGPRVVTLYIKSRDGTTIDTTVTQDDSDDQDGVRGSSVPVLLHVCQESRDFFLGTHRYGPYFKELQAHPVYFDYGIDSLAIECVGKADQLSFELDNLDGPLHTIARQLSHVKRLMLPEHSPFLENSLSLLEFTDLKSLTIITDGSAHYWLGEDTDDEDNKNGPETLGTDDHIEWYTWFHREEIAGVEMGLEDASAADPEWNVPEVRWRSYRVLDLIDAGEIQDTLETWML